MNNRKIWLFSMVLLLMAVVLFSCNKEVVKSEKSVTSEILSAESYLPLKKGNSWTYEVREFFNKDKAAQPGSLLTKVIENNNGQVTVLSGDQIVKYQIKNEGIFKQTSNTILIPSKISKGMQWEIEIAGIKGKGTVKSTNEQVVTPAGLFEHCLVIEERFDDDGLFILYSYAPFIGLARIEEYVIMDEKEYLHIQANLRVYNVQ